MDIIISLNKPRDITSQDAVTKVKRILNVKKAGHTGTLDPMATGLLLVCINKATRLASYFTDLDKEYRAVLKLGESTDTQDARGIETASSDKIDFDENAIREALKAFEGRILQQPPMFSALKHKGKALYKYARQGIEIERKPREITIYSIELLRINIPYVEFKVRCSKGTYIRTLSYDIGQKLGTEAHLSELERTSIGSFSLNESLSPDELMSAAERAQLNKGIYTLNEALYWMPEFIIKADQIKAVIHGNPITLKDSELSEEYENKTGIRITTPDGDLLAIGSYLPPLNIIKMGIVFA
ncbi:MAG TPA: tRNA pseudouridine(55) synthase TruB [Nitrospirae bacterium]|nr:tRNA pseudouridine synthase B [bacterium BMS3Abin09]GBE40283.1 tRNA pseudouridine synthase B [bacterium BMS3Bbin09]HDN95130.1 tRNA pseudouridine(55) synthase TruB [Nitrospirota bacterium]HDZ84414.1 tRNA pseudouridine(55) synthase TruB [Nitrospirota bacterium]